MVDAKVVECLDVTPGLREIRLRGPAFGVVTSKPAAHAPVEIAVDGGHVLRTYSVWAHDRVTASLTLRVVAHDPGGPGSRWAAGVSVGTRLRIGLPRNRITLDPTARYHVFVGEETAAIPLLTMLAALPPTPTRSACWRRQGRPPNCPFRTVERSPGCTGAGRPR
jgi:NADPH-dependent ferric siderophore reductase